MSVHYLWLMWGTPVTSSSPWTPPTACFWSSEACCESPLVCFSSYRPLLLFHSHASTVWLGGESFLSGHKVSCCFTAKLHQNWCNIPRHTKGINYNRSRVILFLFIHVNSWIYQYVELQQNNNTYFQYMHALSEDSGFRELPVRHASYPRLISHFPMSLPLCQARVKTGGKDVPPYPPCCSFYIHFLSCSDSLHWMPRHHLCHCVLSKPVNYQYVSAPMPLRWSI